MCTKNILKTLCLAHAPSSREDFIYSDIKSIFSQFGEVRIDDMNNIIIHKKGNNKGSIMIMAHSDEIFLILTEIRKDGTLKFKGVGVDPKALICEEVVIHGRSKILGVIGTNLNKEKVNTCEDLIIETGYSKEDLEDKISIGDFVTINGNFIELLNNNISCKSMDNRASIVSMYECANYLKDKNHDLDVYFVCSCQEEVGHRGAKMATFNIKPNIGIAIDTTFDSGSMGDSDRENILENGPVICLGPNLHHGLNKKIISIADKYKIPYGLEVEPGNTGTDAWDIQVSTKGVPTSLISIPIRYMHTPVEVVNINDIKNTGLIIGKFIEHIKSEDMEGILCF